VPRGPVWYFDLDGTLHDAAHAIFGAIDARMTSYVQTHLQVSREQANHLRQTYWQRYGATLLGLIRHHGVNPHHFLRETHDFDVPALLRAERGLGQLFARLPGRKVLLTNAPRAYADRVLAGIGLHRTMGTRYSIESMRLHGSFRPKPSQAMLRYMLARERAARGSAILVEDSSANLKAARAAGFRTVLVQRGGRGGRPAYVGLRVRSVRQLPRALAALRAG
jgi:putative hydrolase of the HAD superfamily